MGYYFNTKNTQYVVRATMDPNRMVINGGQFQNKEIYTPNGLVGEGQPFCTRFTDNVVNGPLANRVLNTSSIVSVHSLRETEQDKMQTQKLLDQQAMQMRRDMRVQQAENLYSKFDQSSQYQYE